MGGGGGVWKKPKKWGEVEGAESKVLPKRKREKIREIGDCWRVGVTVDLLGEDFIKEVTIFKWRGLGRGGDIWGGKK